MNNISLRLKKICLFGTYVVFNLSLTMLLLTFRYGYLFVALFVVGGHARDVFSVVYQVFNMKKILRSCPDIDQNEEGRTTICCLVPVYNEEPSMLQKNLHGLTTQNLSANTNVVVLLLFDGLTENNTELFDSVIDLVGDWDSGCGKERWYQNWKSKQDAKLVYSVGRYNNTTVILSHKQHNSGKKDSLIVGEKFITTSIPDIEAIGVRRVDFIYHTDGDTVSDENCLNEMLKSLRDDAELDGVSGLLRAHARENASCTARGFVMMQDFQYFFSLIVRRMTESLMNSTTCLPGCSNMIRVGLRSEAAIEKYGNLPPNESSLLQAVTRMQGTDRRYTTLLLKQGSRLQMNWRAHVYTEPPLDAASFINQRRRWSSNSFFNSLVVLYSRNIPLYVRVSTLFDIARIFSTLFRFISYFCFWILLDDFSIVNVLFLSLVIILPYVYAFVWIGCIVPEWKQMIMGFFLNKICMPFLSVIAVTKMFMTSTNFAWGSTASSSSKSTTSTPRQALAPPGPFCSPPTHKDAPNASKKMSWGAHETMSLSPERTGGFSPPEHDKEISEISTTGVFFYENPRLGMSSNTIPKRVKNLPRSNVSRNLRSVKR